MRTITIIGIVVIGLLALIWIGLQMTPSRFPSYPEQAPAVKKVPLPKDLPPPVERFYRQVFGDSVPVIESAVITGRATLRPVAGISVPARFRFTHIAGRDYRHYIEATIFGLPIMKVNERYLDSKALMEMPWGKYEGPKLNQAANIGMWAESAWLPSLFITDLRVHWEPVDDVTALLVVPFEDKHERFLVRFDPHTGLLQMMEAMRYREWNSEQKTLWINDILAWSAIGGYTIPATGSVTWFDQGKPWAVFTVEDVVYNVNVREYSRAKGL
jgi:hypothetical protein